ncbi:MAG: hypothetical protein QF921_13150, partial [Pseudomonadales bacterium]|nr:hypothetical protein [Pseudomonadales bacterium]
MLDIDTPARRVTITVILVAVMAISWHGGLDRSAIAQTDATFTRALATYAIARTLNGVISVAQGTEIAVQPVGVGMTITIGEILDPLNDLVERFSWLALAASASLGTQALMTDILAGTWLNITLTAAVLILLAVIWIPAARPWQSLIARVCGAIVFTRFLFTLTALVVVWADGTFLESRQNEAIENITEISDQLANTRNAATREDSGWFDWLGERISAQERVNSLQREVQSSIGEMVNLMVVFIVQTLLIP